MKRRKRTPEPGTVGEILRRVREREGLTLGALGESAGLSFGFISEVELNTRVLTRPRLEQILSLIKANKRERAEAHKRARLLPATVEQRLLDNPDIWDIDLEKLLEAVRMTKTTLRGTPLGDKLEEALDPQPW